MNASHALDRKSKIKKWSTKYHVFGKEHWNANGQVITNVFNVFYKTLKIYIYHLGAQKLLQSEALLLLDIQNGVLIPH